MADDTAAFAAAMTAASNVDAVSFADGPTGDVQSVVYVPPGTYRLLNLTFPSNMRMEVDAGAVLEQAGGRNASSVAGSGPAVVFWDGPAHTPLRNVSLVGVGTGASEVKSLADPAAGGWSLDGDFAFDLDPSATDASNIVSGLMAMNVDGFLVANVFSVQNDSQPAMTPITDADWWPSSRKAALGIRARRDTPLDGSAFYDPHNGTITNWYNVHSPRGFGPNQIDSGHNLAFSHIYSQGGTALRFETDNSNHTKFGSELRSITADGVEGVDCNRAVSFSPHFQTNVDVHVTDVRATSCYQGVVEAVDEGIAIPRRGAFVNSTIGDVIVIGGAEAQDPAPNNTGLWTTGTSSQAFARESGYSWAVTYDTAELSCSGGFQWPSDSLQTTVGPLQPACENTVADPAVPTAPTIGVATIVVDKATVTFSPAANDGGSPITGYRLISNPGGLLNAGTTSPISISGLTAGTTYTFTVVAVNGVGSGPRSDPSNSVTADQGSILAPATVSATALKHNRVQITWSKVAGAKSFLVSRADSTNGPYSVIGTATGLKYTDPGLRPATTYYYVVQAVSSLGNSPPSNPVLVTTLPAVRRK